MTSRKVASETEPRLISGPVRQSDRSESQTVLRACAVLASFQVDGEELASSEVIRRTRLPKTTVLRLLRSLLHGSMLERTQTGIYRRVHMPSAEQAHRIGFAFQSDSEFTRTMLKSVQLAAARDHIQLISVNNRYSAREAIRNADHLIKQEVDLVFEFQTYDRIAPTIASRFQVANIPVIAIEIPQRGATYFGSNNYKAGLIGGRALGRWAREHWNGEVEQVMLLDLPIAGPVVELRMRGLSTGLQIEYPALKSIPVARLNGRGEFEEVYSLVRQFLRRARIRRTIIGAVNDICALAALRAFEDAGASEYCAVIGQNGILEARNEMRQPESRMIGTVAYFPERYGSELLALARMMLEGKPVPAEVFVKHQLITSRNVDLLYPLDRASGTASQAAKTVATGLSSAGYTLQRQERGNADLRMMQTLGA